LNLRDRVLHSLTAAPVDGYRPAAFFLHFGSAYQRGQAAVDRHLEFFRTTGMDFVKIQYELAFPHLPEIKQPRDWAKMPLYTEDYYQPHLEIVEGLVRAAGREALVIQTLYSPFMCAGHTTSDAVITSHLLQDPESVRRGLEIITESLLIFVRACKRLGVDGFYASTQGAEAHRFADPSTFEHYIKPYDLTVLQETKACPLTILHICDYCGPYADLTPFIDYPGQVINASLALTTKTLTPRDISAMFERPFMGGMDRHGVIARGDHYAIRNAVRSILADAPDGFVLGADCTVPGETPWDHLRTAIELAHQGDRP